MTDFDVGAVVYDNFFSMSVKVIEIVLCTDDDDGSTWYAYRVERVGNPPTGHGCPGIPLGARYLAERIVCGKHRLVPVPPRS